MQFTLNFLSYQCNILFSNYNVTIMNNIILSNLHYKFVSQIHDVIKLSINPDKPRDSKADDEWNQINPHPASANYGGCEKSTIPSNWKNLLCSCQGQQMFVSSYTLASFLFAGVYWEFNGHSIHLKRMFSI